jgi:hypothetical protein
VKSKCNGSEFSDASDCSNFSDGSEGSNSRRPRANATEFFSAASSLPLIAKAATRKKMARTANVSIKCKCSESLVCSWCLGLSKVVVEAVPLAKDGREGVKTFILYPE